ncbi:hypothetical protein BCR42DRAFT_398150 [Absidia repens]|uniref:Reverse transcriptase zinc-binding domain-containing protein n=1 Tax=Absidia repens TaxID=90262 RepID=A0A1X2HYX3_9FUNG|nr:hypothetical protein BCR42DRAFT_398150 [Absidia repens]
MRHNPQMENSNVSTRRASLLSSQYKIAPAAATMMTHKQWSIFWRLKINHGTRTVWWRILTKKLPTKETLRHSIQDQDNLSLTFNIIMETIWTYHWICSFDTEDWRKIWRPRTALSMYYKNM